MGIKSKTYGIIKELAVGVILLIAVSLLINWLRAPKPPDHELPVISGITLEGIPLKRILQKGQPVMIHFWGTWCPVCRQEAGNIGRVAQHYRVLTVAVNSGSDSEIRQWMKHKGVAYPVYNDRTGKLARQFDVEIYPTTFIYDAEGKLKFVETGYTTTAGLLARMKLAE